jgi:2-methylisocitrate lyase-like PEP mutase family enzyme
MTTTPATLAARFRARHREGSVLLLPNAWDAGSALLMESLGAEAIATTSSGVAWAHGYSDGDRLPVAAYAEALREIARVVSCPISADAEGGYGTDPAAVRENLARLIGAGAVGFDLEDGNGAPALLCRKIEAAKAAAAHAGVDVFVNARTDVFLKALAPGRAVEETLARAAQYATAGADGLFVPAAISAAEIDALVKGQALPLNVMARPGLPPLATLARLGVRRLSAGSAIAQAALGTAKRLASQFLAEGSTDALFAGALPYAEGNALFAR